MTILSNTLALIVVLSVLVVVHEFGHFAVAKAFRFPVEVFSVGFGKRLFGRKWRGTDYRVSAIPLGGYVRVIGLGPDESTLAEGTSHGGAARRQALAARARSSWPGPAMNFVLAIVLHTAVFVVGVKVPGVRAPAAGHPGRRAGLAGRRGGVPAGRPDRLDQRARRRRGGATSQFLFAHERAREARRRGRPRRPERRLVR